MLALVAIAAVAMSTSSSAETSDSLLSASELKGLPLEQMFDVSVTLVSKRPEKLSETPSAIQVITSEDIRRSGATHLADVLRLASNVEVQQINSYAWVVSTRGFDALFANKLLVMIDGRTVYTPLDAGVFWDAQGLLLEDIDRIEVISGPGGTLWGANAVNGVINMITKSASETQGVYVSGGAGSFLEGYGAARFGGSVGSRSSYRVYGQRFDRNGTRLPNGDEGNNAWRSTQGGFRWDSRSEASSLTIQGDGYAAREYNTPGARSTLDGQNILGRWTRTFSEASGLDWRVYADRTWRRDLPSTLIDQLLTIDSDLQHHFRVGQGHDLLWGFGFRWMDDNGRTSTPYVGFVPTRRTMRLFSAFVQDEITLVPGRLAWTVGSKLEHNEFSDFEAQPSTRLTWTPNARQTLWMAVSRAVRAPSRVDIDYHIPKTPPYAIAGGPDFHAEKLVAYETGYRVRPLQILSLSLATFYNHYDDLYSVELENPSQPLPYTIQNGVAGQSWGVEVSGLYQALPLWRFRGGYAFFKKDLWSRPGHDVLPNVLASLGNDPRNQVVIQSMISAGAHVECDATLRYVDRLSSPRVPSYVAVDGRLGVRRGPVEIAVVGQNLTEKAHPEFYAAQEVPRSFYGSVTIRR
jgi:iron complex outermembrane recepter protein